MPYFALEQTISHRTPSIPTKIEATTTNIAIHSKTIPRRPTEIVQCVPSHSYHNMQSKPTQKTRKKLRKAAKDRNPNNEIVTTHREVMKLACFNWKPSTGVQKIEKATTEHAAHCPIKGNTTLSSLVTPSLCCIFTCDAVFEHTFIQLILPEHMSTTDVENLR